MESTGAYNLNSNALAGILTCGQEFYNETAIEFPPNCATFYSSVILDNCY
jgi:hypothetical protein